VVLEVEEKLTFFSCVGNKDEYIQSRGRVIFYIKLIEGNIT
jgi:hypothetical protein